MTVINGNYREYRLDNGLVVALQNTSTQTIAAKLRVNYGSSHEKEEEEGMAHFLEHCLVSGGSIKYDPISADEIRGTFGYSNAFTNIDMTNFIAFMLKEDLESWFDYISEHVFRPRFEKERINGERERVLREISDRKSDSTHQASMEFNSIFYRDHPKGRFNLGKEDVVKNADIDKIRAFHSRGYAPNNMDLIIAGALPENIEKLVINYFGNIPKGENTRREFPKLKDLEDKSIVRRAAPDTYNTEHPEESSAQIVLAYIAPPNTHEDEYTIRMITNILGGDTNSFLFQNMGLKKGLAYYVESTYNGDYNAGEIHINTSVPAKRIDEAIDTIFEEIFKIRTQKVNEKILERVRRKAKYNLANTFESNEGHISAIELKLDEGITPESYIENYNKVNSERILEVANRYLPDRNNGRYVLYIRDPLKKE